MTSLRLRHSLDGLRLVSDDYFTRIERAAIAESKGKAVTPSLAKFHSSLHVVRMLQRRLPYIQLEFDPETIFETPAVDVPSSTLFPYQKEGVRFLAGSRGALLSFEPGLGKSATSIISADIVGAKRILVVTLLTLLPTWERQIDQWSQSGTTKTVVRTKGADCSSSRWVLTNIDHLVRHTSTFDQDWDVIILDESIVVKSRDAKRSRTMKSLRKRARYLWMLSGAPISRDISDLWSQLNILHPSVYSSFWRFVNEYCVVQDTAWGKSIVGSKPGIDWHAEFRDVIMTVSKVDAKLDLPDLIFEEILVDLDNEQKDVYAKIHDEFVLQLATGDVPLTTKVAQMVRLCQASSDLSAFGYEKPKNAKLTALIELLGTEVIQPPVIVWTRFVGTSRRIAEELVSRGYRVGLLIGDTPAADRDQLLQAFGSTIDVIVMNLAVGRYGLTLTQAESMVYFDLDWNMETIYQSVNRVHRIGLDHQPTVFRLIAKGTIDETLLRNLRGKAIDLSRLTGETLMGELLRDYSRN